MMTVHEVSKLTGVSIRTLHYYDKIGLLSPASITPSGYRLYDDNALESLQQILLFRELEFPLKKIKRILNSPDFDRNRALEQQIELLTLKKEHLQTLIDFARGIHGLGVKNMDFKAFDTRKLDEYAKEAKATWGKTDAYKEFEQKSAGRTKEEENRMFNNLMTLFVEFGQLKENAPESDAAQKQVEKLRNFITVHFYNCTLQILSSLGKMYSGGGSFTENIDEAGGSGTAEFTDKAIQIYCSRQES